MVLKSLFGFVISVNTCIHVFQCSCACRLSENPWAARAWESGPAGDAGRGGHEGFPGGLPGGEEVEGSQWWTAGELCTGGQETFNRSIPGALGLRRHKHMLFLNATTP